MSTTCSADQAGASSETPARVTNHQQKPAASSRSHHHQAPTCSQAGIAASSCGSTSWVGPSYLWWCTGGRPAGGAEQEEEEGRRVLGAVGPGPGLGPAGSEPV